MKSENFITANIRAATLKTLELDTDLLLDMIGTLEHSVIGKDALARRKDIAKNLFRAIKFAAYDPAPRLELEDKLEAGIESEKILDETIQTMLDDLNVYLDLRREFDVYICESDESIYSAEERKMFVAKMFCKKFNVSCADDKV